MGGLAASNPPAASPAQDDALPGFEGVEKRLELEFYVPQGGNGASAGASTPRQLRAPAAVSSRV